jgi:hypothetical protein
VKCVQKGLDDIGAKRATRTAIFCVQMSWSVDPCGHPGSKTRFRCHPCTGGPKACVDNGTLLRHTQYVHMNTKRAHILLPEDLLREIDALVGPRGRSSFLVETAREEVRRQKLLRFLKNEDPDWKSEHHPELAEGAASWVRKLRTESEGRGATRKKPNRARAKSSTRRAY